MAAHYNPDAKVHVDTIDKVGTVKGIVDIPDNNQIPRLQPFINFDRKIWFAKLRKATMELHTQFKADEIVLSLLVDQLQTYSSLKTEVWNDGMFIYTSSGAKKPHPLLPQLQICIDRIQKLLRELEITPATRKKRTGEEAKSDDVYAQIMAGFN